MNSYKLKNVVTKEIIEEPSIPHLSKRLGVDESSLLRLLKRDIKGKHYNSVQDKYINLFDSKTFTLVDYDTGEEFECATNNTLFMYFNIPRTENMSKYITALKSQRQKVISIDNRVLFLKDFRPIKISPKKSFTPSVVKQRENRTLNRKIKSKLMCRINNLKRKESFEKCGRTEELLGCSIEEFKDYLESKFLPKMSWDNHGNECHSGNKSWHIDHIIPCNTFDLTIPEQQKKCFHYSNMRPLWEKDNYSRPKDGSDIY